MGAFKGSETESRPSFTEWIDSVGIEVLAAHLKVHPMTVRYWRAGRCDPKVDHMRRIKKLSRGLVGYEQIIDRHVLTSRVRGNRGTEGR